MTLTAEDIEVISALLDKKLDEKLDKNLKPISDKITTLEIKQDVTSRKLEDIIFRQASQEHDLKKEFSKIDDQLETLIAVLEAKGILPKQA